MIGFSVLTQHVMMGYIYEQRILFNLLGLPLCMDTKNVTEST